MHRKLLPSNVGINNMMKLIAITMILIAGASACDSCNDQTTINVQIHGFSDGVYDFVSSIESSGMDWERTTIFAPDAMMSETNFEADDCFKLMMKDELWFNKIPNIPTDPYFMMSMDASGKNGDDFKSTMQTLFDMTSGAMMQSTGDGSFNSLRYHQFVDNFHGWTADIRMNAEDEELSFTGIHSYNKALDELESRLKME
jgi:hypothetical protein